jgi:hypothetical protein
MESNWLIMSTQPVPICAEHQVSKEWKPTTFAYDDDGISIQVPNVYAWVCPEDGEPSFTPDTTDELIATVRELITPAKRARERRSTLTEYIVRVA